MITTVHKSDKPRTEKFDPQKLHRSIQATCLSVHVPEGQSQLIADLVTEAVSRWVKDKSDVTSQDIRTKAAEALSIHNPDAAYLYKNNQRIV